jgi:hypothetical protein
MKTIMIGLVLVTTIFLPFSSAFGDKGVIVFYKSGCDYFIADGPNGYYLLEWYGGYDPSEGDIIIGRLNSYGFKNVYYPRQGKKGRIYVEDYLLSKDDALEKYFEHCD